MSSMAVILFGFCLIVSFFVYRFRTVVIHALYDSLKYYIVAYGMVQWLKVFAAGNLSLTSRNHMVEENK